MSVSIYYCLHNFNSFSYCRSGHFYVLMDTCFYKQCLLFTFLRIKYFSNNNNKNSNINSKNNNDNNNNNYNYNYNNNNQRFNCILFISSFIDRENVPESVLFE